MNRIRRLFDEEAACSESGSGEDEDSEIFDDDKSDSIIDDVEDDDLTSNNNNSVKVTSNKTKSRKQPAKKTPTEKLPGDKSLPLHEFSLTIAKTKEDIPASLLKTIYEQFILKYCVKGGVATEVGTRAGNLHLQGVAQLHSLTNAAAMRTLSKLSFKKKS
jgi:hypothetical protein